MEYQTIYYKCVVAGYAIFIYL